jgi:L-alanine-DL-glutamate epimerase-like enolase superfamily enzyme
MAEQNLRLTWQPLTLQLRNPFRVSYGASETRRAFWLRLTDDEGWGEGTIPPYYGVSDQEMAAFWANAAGRPEPFPEEPADIPAWIGEAGPAPARAALDLALHDRIGRRQGIPLYQLLQLPQPQPMPTAFTVSIDTPEEMARQAAQVQAYPIIKVKLGSDDDAARLAAVRAARPDARLFIDANAAWAPDVAVQQLEKLLPYNLELVEQPVSKGDFDGLGYVQARIPVPVVADESVQTLTDIARLAAVGVQGVNLKLMKVGGLSPCLQMLRRARELNMKIMLGCMVETSLGVTAMAHLSGLADWLDLDAPLLIGNDPFDGVSYDQQATMTLPARPGIGILLHNVSESNPNSPG